MSPVGDWERLEAALTYGADAVYLGRPEFSMRAAANYFQTPKQLAQAVRLTHQYGKRLYLTCNTLPRDKDIAEFPQFLQEACEAGVDALILTDLGLLALTRKYAPQMEIHMSTQAGLVNAESCRMLYELGVRRAVLARELSLSEITEIRRHIPSDMELEVFVHGAMCMSFSGRCMLSAYMTGRDANRGLCAQPCRWKYYVMEETRPGQFFPLVETKDGTYLFNAMDLCMIEHIPDLLAAGVSSLKLEGRNKSAYYVATVTNAYRAALDAALRGETMPPWAKDEVLQVSHREYCTGFFYGKDGAKQRFSSGGYVQNSEVVAVVERFENGRLYLTQRNRFFAGDTLEVVQKGLPAARIAALDLRDNDGQELDAARCAMMACSTAWDTPFPRGSFVRKKIL